MKPVIFLISLVSFLVSASAYPLPVPTAGSHCSSYRAPADDLRQLAAVAKNDTRCGLSAKGAEYGLSAEEIEQLRGAILKVSCPDRTKATGWSGSTAAIVGKPNTAIATAHQFFKKDNTKRGPWKDCFVEPKTEWRERRPIDFSKERFRVGTERPYDGPAGEDLDYAILKIKGAAPAVEPLSIDSNPSNLSVNEELIVVSAQQLRMNCAVVGNEPVIQKCSIQKVYGPNHRAGSVIYTNCSATGLASGSVALRRDSTGKLGVVGTLIGTGDDEKDGQDFSMETKNFTRFNIIDDRFKRDFDEVNTPADRASSL